MVQRNLRSLADDDYASPRRSSKHGARRAAIRKFIAAFEESEIYSRYSSKVTKRLTWALNAAHCISERPNHAQVLSLLRADGMNRKTYHSCLHRLRKGLEKFNESDVANRTNLEMFVLARGKPHLIPVNKRHMESETRQCFGKHNSTNLPEFLDCSGKKISTDAPLGTEHSHHSLLMIPSPKQRMEYVEECLERLNDDGVGNLSWVPEVAKYVSVKELKCFGRKKCLTWGSKLSMIAKHGFDHKNHDYSFYEDLLAGKLYDSARTSEGAVLCYRACLDNLGQIQMQGWMKRILSRILRICKKSKGKKFPGPVRSSLIYSIAGPILNTGEIKTAEELFVTGNEILKRSPECVPGDFEILDPNDLKEAYSRRIATVWGLLRERRGLDVARQVAANFKSGKTSPYRGAAILGYMLALITEDSKTKGLTLALENEGDLKSSTLATSLNSQAITSVLCAEAEFPKEEVKSRLREAYRSMCFWNFSPPNLGLILRPDMSLKRLYADLLEDGELLPFCLSPDCADLGNEILNCIVPG